MIVIDAKTVHEIMDWPRQIEALRNGHRGERPSVDDLLMRESGQALLVRAAWARGAGIGLKAVTVFPDNPGRTPPLPAVQGQFLLFDADSGAVSAAIDGAAITAWKTAGDSALGADLLAREDAAILTMIGAGAMAEPLIRAHLSVRPSIERIIIWNRSAQRAEALAARLADTGRTVGVSEDRSTAIGKGDVVSCATMSREPVVDGSALKPGAHLDLVGAFTPDMREADDTALTRGRLFVDARETTIHEIGELMIPLKAGTISESDILGDLFDLVPGRARRQSDDEITVYKNGGGAHLDLMTAQAIHAAWLERNA
jgi:ornithine cyclodeaminase/alanine dehydrogenase-like protein (mu-crystallin family)